MLYYKNMMFAIEIVVLHPHDDNPFQPLQVATRKTLESATKYLSKLPQKYRRVVLMGHVAIARDDENRIVALLMRSYADKSDDLYLISKDGLKRGDRVIAEYESLGIAVRNDTLRYYLTTDSFEFICFLSDGRVSTSRHALAVVMALKKSAIRPSQDALWDQVLDSCLSAITTGQFPNYKILLKAVNKNLVDISSSEDLLFIGIDFRNILERTMEFTQRGTFHMPQLGHSFSAEDQLRLCNAMREELPLAEMALHLILEELRQA